MPTNEYRCAVEIAWKQEEDVRTNIERLRRNLDELESTLRQRTDGVVDFLWANEAMNKMLAIYDGIARLNATMILQSNLGADFSNARPPCPRCGVTVTFNHPGNYICPRCKCVVPKPANKDGGTEDPNQPGSSEVLSQALREIQPDSPACDVCGTITVRAGSGFKCLNCGNTMGCG